MGQGKPLSPINGHVSDRGLSACCTDVIGAESASLPGLSPPCPVVHQLENQPRTVVRRQLFPGQLVRLAFLPASPEKQGPAAPSLPSSPVQRPARRAREDENQNGGWCWLLAVALVLATLINFVPGTWFPSGGPTTWTTPKLPTTTPPTTAAPSSVPPSNPTAAPSTPNPTASSAPPLPPLALAPHGYDERPCVSGEVCVGLGSCAWRELQRSSYQNISAHTQRFSTRSEATYLPGPAYSPCLECGCQPVRYPAQQCNVTVIRSREDAVGTGSLINSAMLDAVRSVARGQGVQMPAEVCAEEDRSSPHCLFRPSSNCGSHAQAEFGIPGPDLRPTDDELSSACRKAAASLGIEAANCAGLDAWRMVAKLVLRLQPDIAARIQRNYLDEFGWARVGGTFAAVHIRRGDKVTVEANATPTCAYADQLARISQDARGLHVFVATDEAGTVVELQGCATSARLEWHVHTSARGHVLQNTQTATKIGQDATYRLWADLTMLVRAKWAVVTFTSNMGRLVQLLRDQPHASCGSGDRPRWGYGPWRRRRQQLEEPESGWEWVPGPADASD